MTAVIYLLSALSEQVYSFESAVPTPVPPTPVPPVPATPAPGSSSGHSPAESDDYTYVGCYADSSPRTFTGPSTSSSSMTADVSLIFFGWGQYWEMLHNDGVARANDPTNCPLSHDLNPNRSGASSLGRLGRLVRRSAMAPPTSQRSTVSR